MGAITMASTPWLMKLRTALICAAGSLSAALNTSSKPFSSENASFMDSVLALRHPDSDPVWAKPTLIVPSPPESLPESESPPQPAAKSATAPTRATPVRNFVFTPNLLAWTGMGAGRVWVTHAPGTALLLMLALTIRDCPDASRNIPITQDPASVRL